MRFDKWFGRKQGSEAWLAARGVPAGPFFGGAADINLRPAKEVAERALVLEAVGETSSALEAWTFRDALEWLEKTGIDHALTDKERAYLHSEGSDFDRNQFSWRCEAAWTLAWALGWAQDLGGFETDPHLEFCQATVMKEDGLAFLVNPQLRPKDEISAAEDLNIRIHWAIRNAELKGLPPIEGINVDVIMERHHAFNWLIDPVTPWEEITLDT